MTGAGACGIQPRPATPGACATSMDPNHPNAHLYAAPSVQAGAPAFSSVAAHGSGPGAAASTAKADAELEARAEEICGRLLIDRYLAKREYRDLLLDDELRAVVARRLDGVGLQLVESFTSDWFAVRLKRTIESDIAFDWATNTRLPRGAVALLVILWARLVLPKRIDASEVALQKQLQAAQAAKLAAAQAALVASGGEDVAVEPPARPATPVAATGPVLLHRDTLYAEFGRKFGKTAFARYLGQLKSAGFVAEDRQGRLREGPLLDLLVDGVEMAQKLRDSVLWDLLERDGGAGDAAEPANDGRPTDDDDAFDDE